MHATAIPTHVLRASTIRWRIELFGGIRARADDRLVDTFRTRHAAVLLARLAVHARAHARDELVEMLWPLAPAPGGRQRLSQALSELRRRLDPALIEHTADTVRLAAGAFVTDLGEFDDAVARASHARGLPRLRWLERAANLARAPLLPGVDLPWALAAREAAEAACDGALRELVAHHVRRGRISAAFACAARRVRLDPLGEEAHREWARLYRRAGRTAAALGHLEAFERAMRAAADADPDDDTRALATVLRDRLRALARPVPPAPGHRPPPRR